MKLSTEGKFRLAVKSALLASMAVGPQQGIAQDADEASDLGTLEVTGSRLQRTDVEGSLPVTVIDRQQIEASGLPSVADVIRAQTFNSFGSYRETSGNSFTGQSQVSLRGLGADRTLVLINGRRVPPSPVSGAAGVDLNSIPLAAVERVEILRDGASAIYGSDAIGGVINVILRKDMNEAVVTASMGTPTREGGDESSASFVSGFSDSKNSIVFGMSYFDRNHVALRDRDYSSFFPGDGENFSTIRGANEVGNTLYGFYTYQYYAAPSCAPERVYNYDIAGGEVCIFPFADIAYDTTDLRNTSFFISGERKINDKFSVNYQTNYARVESFGRFAPVADALYLPVGAAANPLDEPIFLFHRYEQLGPRDTWGESTILDVMLSLSGEVASVPFEAGVRQSRYDFSEIGRNYTLRSVAREYLSNGTYDPYDLTQNDPEILQDMKATIGRDGRYVYTEGFVNTNFDAFALPAGMVRVGLGLETRRDEYYDIYDAMSEAGNVGGSAGNSASGKRSANAGYMEALVPILSSLELNAALRYDEYSDFGDATTGKVSLRYQPVQMVTLRASYGTGFRAPSLSELYGAQSSDAPTVRDFTQCRAQGIDDADCPATQVSTGQAPDGSQLGGIQGSNPDLLAEESDQYSLGIAFAPVSWVDMSLDYYKIELDDAIQAISYQELIRREANGDGLPPGTEIVRQTTNTGIPGRILRIVTGPANVATVETDGFDFNVTGRTKFVGFSLTSDLNLSWVNEYVDSLNKPGQDQVGDPGVPEYRATWSNTLRYGNLALNYFIYHIADTSALTVPTETGLEEQVGHVSSFTTHDFQLTYYSPIKTELSVGVRNAFDKGPSTNFEGLDNPYYDSTLYDPYGRVPYVTIKQTF